MPELDKKAATVFAGKIVRKDLVRKVKVGAGVPVFVLEYLLGKYCATDDLAAIDAGLRVVNTTLSTNVARPEEANKAQSMVRDKGTPRTTHPHRLGLAPSRRKVQLAQPSHDRGARQTRGQGDRGHHAPAQFPSLGRGPLPSSALVHFHAKSAILSPDASDCAGILHRLTSSEIPQM